MKVADRIAGSVSKKVVRTSERSAIKSVNTACHAWQYEPKLPKALKKRVGK